jgi:hypothetical protein
MRLCGGTAARPQSSGRIAIGVSDLHQQFARPKAAPSAFPKFGGLNTSNTTMNSAAKAIASRSGAGSLQRLAAVPHVGELDCRQHVRGLRL